MSPRPQLKFAILSESQHCPAWAAECVRHVRASGHAELVLFINNGGHAQMTSHRPRGALHRLYDNRWLQRRSRALQRVDLLRELEDVDQISCAPGTELQSLQPEDLSRVREYELDFILAVGPQRPRGDILAVPRAGVWSYGHDREAAPYFWELLSGEPRTRATLDRLGAEGGSDLRLHQGFFGTCKASWVNNLDRAAFGSADFCARVCAELSSAPNGELRRAGDAEPAVGHAPRAERAPSDPELLELLLKSGAHTLAKLWELLFHVEIWNVGFSQNSVEQILSQARVDAATVSWCPPHAPDHFIADPFAYSHQGEQHVLVEDYVLGKGRICQLRRTTQGVALELDATFEYPYHMSYPCTFVDAGELYCIPETYQLGKACLYRRVDAGWELVRTLLEGLPVVDPTLFKHDGLYWLFFTRQDDGSYGNLKLYAHYAEHLAGEWKPHLLNPLKCDIGSSRPAGGVLVIDGALYRPSQDCSETYGGAVVMNRIGRLSPTEFEEISAARIEPIEGGPYPAGLHTINSMGSQSVFDSKKLAFDWLAWRKNWGRLHEVFK